MKYAFTAAASLLLVGETAEATQPLCGSLLAKQPKIACGVCTDILSGQDCSRYDACECMGPGHLTKGCVEAGFCDGTDGSNFVPGDFDLRVSKGHGARDYATVRLSVISRSLESPATNGFFDYSAQFKYRWTQNYIHTAVKTVSPGQATKFAIGNQTVTINIPKSGDGAAGVMIGDPCFGSGSITSLVGCTYGGKFKTATRTPALLNAFVGAAETDYWGILGDNFYDRVGDASAKFFGELSQAVKETPLVTVPGNHDYWVLGEPHLSSGADQCANGHMQFYAQDSDAASLVQPGENSAPFNYSVSPGSGYGCHKASADNSRFYQQIGNLGIIAQSGAFTEEEYMPFMERACKWLSSTPGIEVGVIVGHWDNPSLGSQKNMDVPGFFDQMKTLPGCKELDAAKNLKFFMGHTHCNVPHPHGHQDTGFMVAGQGMEGCANYGVPVFDTTGGRNRVYYFDTSTDQKYEAVMACVPDKGWRQCLDLAETWLDQTRSVVQIV